MVQTTHHELVHVLIVSVGELDVLEATVGLVDAQLSVVLVVGHVRVQLVELGHHRTVGNAAANHPGVASESPLRAQCGACLSKSCNYEDFHSVVWCLC